MTDSPSTPWGALARKYATLVALRARRDGGGPPATRDELRALAAEFPGCLRELDTLGADELRRRATAAAAVGPGAPPEPWMEWIAAYHELMAGALAARGRRRNGELDDDPVARAALSPPAGRLNVVVLRALALRFHVPASTIAGVLFPTRRPSPYHL